LASVQTTYSRELEMRSKLASVAVVTFAAIAGCSSSTAPSSCFASKTTAAYQDEPSISVTVTSLSRSGTSELVEAMEPSGSIRFLVADTTPVFVRVANRTPLPTSACGLAVGEVVMIPFLSGFGDFSNTPPASTISQVVIQR
jgi:hypothetical protein